MDTEALKKKKNPTDTDGERRRRSHGSPAALSLAPAWDRGPVPTAADGDETREKEGSVDQGLVDTGQLKFSQKREIK
ncbi:hypothetical protein BRADI_4g12639v3 [Brachypodium distachyon]|uniref:Uncharacterized protein n=1 Tax=Brachypodium distachyon TaxID=15368 RepID=A0A2K2CMC0_BRADI|nr:hypothetical protein BRADI_4g12639v3 [Brachypodium distachyon]